MGKLLNVTALDGTSRWECGVAGGGAERGLKNLAVIGSKVSLPFRTLGPSDTEAVDCCVAAGTRESPAETTH